MGSIYYRKEERLAKRWRVQIRHRGFRVISRSFHTKEEAVEFLKKADRIIKGKIERRKDYNAFEALRN